MKNKKNELLLYIIAFETLFLAYLGGKYGKVQSFLGNFIGLIVYLTPVEVLLHNLSEDEKVSETKRTICRISFWFIIISFLLAFLAELLETMGILSADRISRILSFQPI